ncbi:MAG: hypothetical protein M0Z80_12350 [Treponema sp.]|nr:hypothetical protein [Treponema sp.]
MNNPLRYALCAFFAIAAVGAASALTVSVAPAQHLVESGAASSPTPLDSFMSGCLDGLYDAGFIATDAPARETDRAHWSDATFGLAGTKEGFVDYVVAVFVTWRPSSLKKEVWLATGCDYRIVRVADGKVVATGSAQGETDGPDLVADPDKSARSMGAGLGKSCAALIQSASASNGGE